MHGLILNLVGNIDNYKMNFIKTSNDNVAAQLRAAHFSYLEKDANGFHVFINDGKFDFSQCDQTKLTFTNVIAM